MINRIVEAIETRAEERWPGSRHDDRPLPLPWRRRLDPTSRTPSSTFFVRFSSVFERSRAPLQGREDRGGQHPFLLQPPIAVSRSLSLSLSIPSRSTFLLLPLSIRLSLAANSEHARRVNAPKAPNERPTEPTIYPFCLPTYPSTYLSPLIHSPLLGIPNW